MEDEQKLRLECLKLALSLYKSNYEDCEDYKEILFLADEFFKFTKGEVHV
jgi:hypothetical protein